MWNLLFLNRCIPGAVGAIQRHKLPYKTTELKLFKILKMGNIKMKKTSVISLVVISIIITLFALVNTQPTLATKLDKQSPQSVVVVFTAVGCTAANCSGSYCIGGGEYHSVTSCQFKEVLEPGTYSICFTCTYNRICTKTFVVNDDGSATQYVTLETRDRNGEACNCTNSKKK
jgi:hypothetical protein